MFFHVSTPSAFVRHFSLFGLLTLIPVTGCGEAPTVEAHEQAWEEALPSQGQSQEADADVVQEAPKTDNHDWLETSETDSRALPSDSAEQPAGTAPEQEQACAPTLSAQTQNVPVEVERTVTDTVEVPTEVPVIPTALVLMDRSRSMRYPIQGSPDNRWETLERLLFTGEQPLLEALQDDVALGLTHYTSTPHSEGAGETGSGHCVDLTVPVDQIHFETEDFEELKALQLATEPGLGTPTGEALSAVTSSLVKVESEGEKHIILVTDGEPTHCNDQLGFGSELAVKLVLDAAQAALDQGITVHVIGVGPEVNADHLQDVADAGGGTFHTALSEEDISVAFERVLSEIDVVMVEKSVTHTVTEVVTEEQRSCQFDIDYNVMDRKDFEDSGSVTLDGQELAYDAQDGWGFDEQGQLELRGAACERYLNSAEPLELRSFLACPNNPQPRLIK